MTRKRLTAAGAAALGVILAAVAVAAAAQPPTGAQPAPQERIAALKQSLAEDQAHLRQYEWIETTAVSLKGEEKSRKQNRCYHGADGKVQKVLVAAPPPPEKKRGLRGKIIENKKEELSDYMERAVNLVKLYVPPDPGLIQRAKDAGKASIHMLEPGRRARLEFRDYLEAGDVVGVEVDLTANRLLGLKVSTFLGSPQDPVGLDVRFATLNDGTGYPGVVLLDASAKQVHVAVQNTGYRKVAP